MDNSTFRNPTRVIFGKDTVGQIGRVIRGAALRRVLLVAVAAL
jgi:alcohol dehydrogenase YqhD (iron-dependent ADH family)